MTYTIPDHISGDTWIGINEITIHRNGTPINLTGAKSIFRVKTQIDAPTVLELSSDEGEITYIDPVNGILSISPLIVDIPPGNYIYSLRIFLESGEYAGEVDTFLNGTWKILKYA